MEPEPSDVLVSASYSRLYEEGEGEIPQCPSLWVTLHNNVFAFIPHIILSMKVSLHGNQLSHSKT